MLGKRAANHHSDTLDKSVMCLLREGTDAYLARQAMLILAESSIDVQYFIWHGDLVGKLLFNGLLQAAERGVCVRILLDDININSKVESILYALDQHKNIEVRLYNPFATRNFRVVDILTDAFRINRRMHNKSFTVDDQFTIIGGRNIANEYFSADKQSNFEDIDVMSVGPIVNDISHQFDTYWNSKVVYPVKAFDHNKATVENLKILKKTLALFEKQQKNLLDVKDSGMYRLVNSSLAKNDEHQLFEGKTNVIYDDPEKGLDKSEKEIVYLKSLLKPYLDKTTDCIELISPYFVPGIDGTKYLIGLAKKGIKVRVITNSLSSTDSIMAQSGYAKHRIDLLEGGIELYELKTHFKTKVSRSLRRSEKAKSGLHAKIYIFDRKEVFIGSFNLDQRSANINSEVGVIYQTPEMAKLIATEIFDDGIASSAYKLELRIEIENIDGIEVENKMPVWIETINGKEVYQMSDPKTSFWRRFNEGVFSILPIESQL